MGKTNNYELAIINKTSFTADIGLINKGSIHFNATEIAKPFNKRPSDWLITKEAKEYIEVVTRYENSCNEKLIKIKQGGKYQGTWLHKSLAIEFARWCDKEFAYKLDKWIVQRLQEEHDRHNKRLELRTGYRPLTDAVQESHEPAKFYHFSNEADLLNRIVLGMSAKKYCKQHNVGNVRDNLSAHEIQLFNILQRADTTLHDMGMSHTERKHELTQIYIKKCKNYRLLGRGITNG